LPIELAVFVSALCCFQGQPHALKFGLHLGQEGRGMASAVLSPQHFHLQALGGKFYNAEIGAARFQTVCRHSQGAGIALRHSLLHGFKQPRRITAKQHDGFFSVVSLNCLDELV
jgi:hypothetical protein